MKFNYKDNKARLSPSAVKKADKTRVSSVGNSLAIAIAKELARATSSQLEKSEIHKTLTSNNFMR